MAQDIPTNLNLAFAGEFDEIMSSFAKWIKLPGQIKDNIQMFGLSNIPYQGLNQITWRLGSMVSTQATASMLDGINVLIYSCLTPTDNRKSDEGYARDIEITAAFNLAQHAKSHPECHVILIMRSFPDDKREYRPIYSYWKKILNTFKQTCQNLTVIHTAPILSDLDAFSIAITEYAYRISLMSKNDNIQWLNHTQPVDLNTLFSCIRDNIHAVEKQENIFLYGNQILSYGEWLDQTKQVIRKAQHLMDRIHGLVETESHMRSKLLMETIEFPTADSTPDFSRFPSNKPQNIQDKIDPIVKSRKIGHALRLKPIRHPQKSSQTLSYVLRILSNPKKSVSEITDLLMQWLPRFFQRAVKVETIQENRLLCRLSRIPMLELEKRIESPTRCRLMLRNPWGKYVQSGSSLCVTITGTIDDPGELLIIVEDTPDFKPFNVCSRAVLAAFGKYLKDYGCGE